MSNWSLESLSNWCFKSRFKIPYSIDAESHPCCGCWSRWDAIRTWGYIFNDMLCFFNEILCLFLIKIRTWITYLEGFGGEALPIPPHPKNKIWTILVIFLKFMWLLYITPWKKIYTLPHLSIWEICWALILAPGPIFDGSASWSWLDLSCRHFASRIGTQIYAPAV